MRVSSDSIVCRFNRRGLVLQQGFSMTMPPNHALQRTRPSHHCCNRCVPRRVAELWSLGRFTRHHES